MDAVLIVPEWPYKAWWHRLWSGAWHTRITAYEYLGAGSIVANDAACFFQGRFETRLVALRLRPC